MITRKSNIPGIFGTVFGLVGLLIAPLWFGLAALACGLSGLRHNSETHSTVSAAVAVALGAVNLLWWLVTLAEGI